MKLLLVPVHGKSEEAFSAFGALFGLRQGVRKGCFPLLRVMVVVDITVCTVFASYLIGVIR